MTENTNTSNAKTFADRAKTDPTALHTAFAAWIKENTGYEPDLKTVQIVCAMRMDFQRSEENQTSLKTRKEAAAKAKVEAAAKRKAKLLAELAKLQEVEQTETSEVEQPKAEEPDASQTPAGAAPDGLGAQEDASETPAEPAKRPVRRRRAAALGAE